MTRCIWSSPPDPPESPRVRWALKRAMAARLDWQLRHYPPRADDIRLAQASMTFLEGGMELLAGLAAGATMILADDAEHRDPEALAALMKRESVAQVTAVPSLVSAPRGQRAGVGAVTVLGWCAAVSR